MTTYKVKIFSHFTFDVWEGDYMTGARDSDTILSEIFRYFNRVDEADVARLEYRGYNLPSLSAGDMVQYREAGTHGKTFLCENSGWKEIF